MLTCQHAEDALTRCPPGYADADIYTFVHCGQSAAIWTFTIIATVEVMTAMVFLVPDVYNRIKEKGRQEGLAKARAEAREKRMADGMREGYVEGVAAVRDAMREAGIDEETRRRVEAIAMRARRNGL